MWESLAVSSLPRVISSFLTLFYFAEFSEILAAIFDNKGSVNFYMFHGGTNFGFMNGANHVQDYARNKAMFPYYAPDVTSYGRFIFHSYLFLVLIFFIRL